MGSAALRRALGDAGIDYAAVQQAYVGYDYGDSTCGQRALYPVGMAGIPAEAIRVDGAGLALQHNLGPGGACVVSLHERV